METLTTLDEIKTMLYSVGWPDNLNTDDYIKLSCDDSMKCDDAEYDSMTQLQKKQYWEEFRELILCVGVDGDMHVGVNTENGLKSCRFRTSCGGGRNKYTRLALMVLACAMKIDKEGE